MNISPDSPFQIIYSLFQHEYLGYLFESFVVELNDKGNLTYSHQNISSLNAKEFDSGLDDHDYELIRLMEEVQQGEVLKKFQKRKGKPEEFFLKTYDKKVGEKMLQMEIDQYLERRRSKIMSLIDGKRLFEMGKDGEPTWKEVNISKTKASVLFHFRRNEDNTHYFPTIKLDEEKLHFYQNGSYLLCKQPAWIVVENTLFTFEKEVNGAKLKPFFNKKFILIPKNVEETYFEKFVAPLIASFDVYAQGFDIKTERYPTEPILSFSEIAQVSKPTGDLFSNTNTTKSSQNDAKVLFELSFQYGIYNYRADTLNSVSVTVEKQGDNYTFHRVNRDNRQEKKFIELLSQSGLNLKSSRSTVQRIEALSWLNKHITLLKEKGFTINQGFSASKKRYFLGETSMDVSITEGIDWFDVKAVIMFGEFEIPFQLIRKYLMKKQREFELPNGEVAVIPDHWIEDFSDLFSFVEAGDERVTLNKMHLSLVKDLKDHNYAQVAMSKKLEQLLDFTEIEDAPMPSNFKGELRPYQKAGFNWMHFLDEYGFGGCLADDMGLGKTVQTLTMLQKEKEKDEGLTSLLIMPTSLVYNWEMEARKFTPKLKILNYTGAGRDKNHEKFSRYDLVLTSYGITRVDTALLSQFYFNYIILDESQVIKNPDSRIFQAVRELKSRRKLVLSGTPIENSTMDLWSQMSFVNPGLLGTQKFFKTEYQIPIEKKGDVEKTRRLNALIKPFILRRDKAQVAKDLPKKIENIKFCDLSEDQRKYYDKEKNAYRSKILDLIENDGLGKSHILLLQGLTRLRQIANHPAMVDPDYKGDSGKMEDITYMIDNALGKNHKLLIFSQFVKHLKIVAKYLDEQKITYAYLDGSVKDRQAEVEKFQGNDKNRVFLISLKAGGLGLNLTDADYVFLLDPWWNPAVEAQAVDRAHRIGQTNTVFTYKFIARDTVEEKILKLQQSKLKLAKELITVEEKFVKSLSQEDIASLFD
ncbi:MAG: SNF2 family DNA or RNA helicase [Gammaproteobacteria bacterium]|jgi:SNF2 family DNA or RNA helicase